MLRNLATSLINARDERIVTTLPKAKELRPFVERVITLSRRARRPRRRRRRGPGSLHLRRQAAGFFHTGNRGRGRSRRKRGQPRAPRTAGVAALKRLFDELGERYKDCPGGYTRIIKLGRRDGDNAELAIVELVDNPREREAAASITKRAKSVTSGKKKSAKASETKEAAGGKRGGRNAEGRGVAATEPAEREDKAGRGGRARRRPSRRPPSRTRRIRPTTWRAGRPLGARPRAARARPARRPQPQTTAGVGGRLWGFHFVGRRGADALPWGGSKRMSEQIRRGTRAARRRVHRTRTRRQAERPDRDTAARGAAAAGAAIAVGAGATGAAARRNNTAFSVGASSSRRST